MLHPVKSESVAMPEKNKQPRKPRQVQPKPQQAEPRVHHLGTAASIPRIAHKLEAAGIETASPVIGGNQLGAEGLNVGSPEIGAPALTEIAATEQPVRQGKGNRPRYKWKEIQAEAFRLFDENGIPENNGLFTDELLTWCRGKWGEKGAPSFDYVRQDKVPVWITEWQNRPKK
jgi:hypothetical protein